MTDKVISFFNCTEVSREEQLSVMPETVEEQIITVHGTEQTAYTYVEQAGCRLVRWITVTAEWVCRTVASKVRAFVRSVVRITGVQILHRCAILRI